MSKTDDGNENKVEDLLGRLTSNGIHFLGVITTTGEMIKQILREDETEELEEYIEILLVAAYKYQGILENVLHDWQQKQDDDMLNT